MESFQELVQDFLAQKRIVVAGVSRAGKGAPANLIAGRLRQAGHDVFPLNPHADSIDGYPCWRSLAQLPEPADAIVIATTPQAAEELVQQCAEHGIRRVWLHRSFGQGSVSPHAVAFCREKGITVLPGGCPMMFCAPVDLGHRCMRRVLKWTGGLPR